MAWIHTGSYRAASSRPTTAAFTPASDARMDWLLRRRSQNGRKPLTSRNEGAKIATRQISAPAQPLGAPCIEAPRKAAKVNSGPGTRSEEHTSEPQPRENLLCRLLLENK